MVVLDMEDSVMGIVHMYLIFHLSFMVVFIVLFMDLVEIAFLDQDFMEIVLIEEALEDLIIET